jgi:hypothetical protein
VLDDVLPPPGCELAFEATAFDVFAGYLVLTRGWQTAIGTTTTGQCCARSQCTGGLLLCGSYDHANSLGFNVVDGKRSKLLAEADGMTDGADAVTRIASSGRDPAS